MIIPAIPKGLISGIARGFLISALSGHVFNQ